MVQRRSETARTESLSPNRIRDMPSRLRPREEMERLGAANVPDDVLLAIILSVEEQNYLESRS